MLEKILGMIPSEVRLILVLLALVGGLWFCSTKFSSCSISGNDKKIAAIEDSLKHEKQTIDSLSGVIASYLHQEQELKDSLTVYIDDLDARDASISDLRWKLHNAVVPSKVFTSGEAAKQYLLDETRGK